MAVTERTQVGIVGGGPAGLLLSHLLALAGIDSVLVEIRSRSHCETRQRAGMLEASTTALLRAAGLGTRLDAEGLHHDGIYLQFSGERHHVSFRDLTGRQVTIYGQTEIVRDLIAARLAAGATLEFSVTATEVDLIDSPQPLLRYTSADGRPHEVACDVIAGCDGFHGICRAALEQRGLVTAAARAYPYGWLGILARAAPSVDQVLYARHENGFALHSMRSPQVSRLYLQVPEDEDIARWPDDRIWDELSRRMTVPGWELAPGPVLSKDITRMRSLVTSPMSWGRLFLAGDAAHIVPPTGAKGLNLAVADVAALAAALTRLLRDGQPQAAREYSARSLERAWQATRLALQMTEALHVTPGQDALQAGLQLAVLRQLTTSRAAATAFAETYAGSRSPAWDPAAVMQPEAAGG
jgi:p-hydroxybenzoate 3-monooxygenase